MRSDGIFIAVEVDEAAAADGEVVARLLDACPVDIFASAENGGLKIAEENLDECVLCRLCLEAAPGAVKVLKLYDAGALLA